MRALGLVALSLMLPACAAASDVGSAAPSGLPLTDAGETTLTTSEPGAAPSVRDSSTSDSSTSDSSRSDGATGEGATGDGATGAETTTLSSTTTTAEVSNSSSTSLGVGPTIAVADPNEAVCAAGVAVAELGSFTSPDDPDAIETYFTGQASAWEDLADVAPAAIAAEAAVVAMYSEDLRALVESADWDLFAVVAEASDLETSSGADLARIVVEQFLVLECDAVPGQPEQATAAFYITLLSSPDDRAVLAEILASAEIFPLDGALCFVEIAAADAMHPLVGAPSTPAQESALSTALNACQLSIGT